MKKKIGYPIIIILGLIPVLIWLGIEPVGNRFSSPTITMTNLGRIASLVGVSFFSLSFLLNTRLKFLENWFGGLDKVYKAHHIFGTTAFILLLLHPIFLSIQYLAISANSAAMFFVPSLDKITVDFGIIALSIMTILLLITFFIKLKYNVWKFSHKFLGLAFALAVIHVLIISSDVSRSAILMGYIVVMILIGVASFIYRTILYGKIKKKEKFTVEKIDKVNDSVIEIVLKPEGEIRDYKAGQFIFVSFKQKGFRESHPFTISSAPQETNLRLTIKELGDWTKNLKNLKTGTKATIEGPYGRFYTGKPNQIWIAGGIGITPFLSMARDLKKGNKIDLFYSVKEESEAVFVDELKKISDNNFKVHILYTSQGKMLTVDYVAKETEIKDKEIFICGPPRMMVSLKKQFLKAGVNKNNIHMEEFGL